MKLWMPTLSPQRAANILVSRCSIEMRLLVYFLTFLIGTAAAGSNLSGAIVLIPDTPIEVELARTPTHSFLAEYERTLIVRFDDNEVLRYRIADDPGGYSRMRIYKISGHEYFLSGDLSFDKYSLHLGGRVCVTPSDLESKPKDAIFVGSFDRDEKGWRFIPANERAEQEPSF